MYPVKRRILLGFFNSKQQIKYGLLNVFFSLLIIFIINSFALYKFSELSNVCSGAGGEFDFAALSTYLKFMMIASGVSVLLTAGVCFVFIVVITHRFFGPVVALNRHLDKMITGDFKDRVHLRDKDELHEFSTKLNKLTEQLETNYDKK